MSFRSTVDVINSSEKSIVLHLEPWGEQFEMQSGERYTILGESPAAGYFEIEHSNDGILVWLWVGAVAYVYSEGVELGASSASRRLPVPEIPIGG